MINAENFAGFLMFVLLASIPTALVLGVVIRRLYARAITRAMSGQSGAPADSFPVPAASHPNGGTLAFDVSPLTRRTPLRIELALRYLLSGLAYAVTLVVIMFFLNDLEVLPLRLSVVMACILFPGLLLAGYVSGLRWYLILALALLTATVLWLIHAEALILLALFAGPTLVFALVIGNPALRTTAVPLFMVAVVLVIPLVFSLEVTLALITVGLLNGLYGLLPDALIHGIYIWLGLTIALVVGAAAALVAVRLIARLTAGSSEFTMQHDLLWMCQTFWMVSVEWSENGAWALTYLLAFAAYRVTLRLLRPGGAAQEVNLLLRVFGQQKSQVSLSRGLLLDWRQTGPVLLIGAADLATETLDAPELAAYLGGGLRRIFIETPEDLQRVATAGEVPLGDGLYPMQDYYCRDNSWRPTVLTLMHRARRVLVDMRGFDRSNAGIQWEIDALADRVPAERIVVLADPNAVAQVQSVFEAAWARDTGRAGTDTLRIRTT